MFDPDEFTTGKEGDLIYISQHDEQTDETRQVILTTEAAKALLQQLIEAYGLLGSN